MCKPSLKALSPVETLHCIILYKSLSVQFSSVAQSCPTLCDPMTRSTPGLPVHHQLPEFTQTHIHRVSDAIQPSHPLSSPSPPGPNPSQHQSLFQWVNSSHEVAKVLEWWKTPKSQKTWLGKQSSTWHPLTYQILFLGATVSVMPVSWFFWECQTENCLLMVLKFETNVYHKLLSLFLKLWNLADMSREWRSIASKLLKPWRTDAVLRIPVCY